VRTPQRAALSPTIPPTLLAIADEVIEKATSVVGTNAKCRNVRYTVAMGRKAEVTRKSSN
jgi:hypothetical protein